MAGGKGKNKQNANGAKASIPNKQAYQRMNYLYQASHVLLTQRLRLQNAPWIPPERSPTSMDIGDSQSKVSPEISSQVKVLDTSARRINGILRNVAQRLQIRISSDIKRILCRDCNSILRPATGNCTTAITQRDTTLEISCTACNRVKRFPLKERRSKEASEGQGGEMERSVRRTKQRYRLKRRKLRIKAQALAAKKKMSAKVI